MIEPLFSVAVIAYNQEKYIAQTLDCILSQSHNYLFEIVIGDDCSIDQTRSILTEYKNKYPNTIKLLFNDENLGITANYFNVLSNCTGKYIMQCAGDDYWLPGKVALQLDFMEKNPEYGMSYTKARMFYQDVQKFSKKAWGGPSVNFSELIQGNSIPALSVIFKREQFNKYLIDIEPEKKDWFMEDYPIWLWFSAKSKIYFFSDVTAVYRVLNESASHLNDFDKDVAFANSFSNVADFFCSLYEEEKLLDIINNQRKYALLNLAFKHHKIEIIKDIIVDLQIVNLRYFVKKIIAKSTILMKIYFHLYDYIYKR